MYRISVMHDGKEWEVEFRLAQESRTKQEASAEALPRRKNLWHRALNASFSVHRKINFCPEFKLN